MNKLDAVADRITRNRLCDRYPYAVGVSAQTGEGLEKLAVRTSDALGRSFRNVEVETDWERSSFGLALSMAKFCRDLVMSE